MFDRLRKAFTSSDATREKAGLKSEPIEPSGPVSEWAASRGFSYSGQGSGKGLTISGKISGKPWILERGASSRKYIRGDELRAKGELKISDEVSVLVMNRSLKDALEKQAYQMYTDTLQTTADPNLPEEMRWLSLYPEAVWNVANTAFWERYAVMADHKEHAVAWLTPELCNSLMAWPEPAPHAQVPFILMLMRSKSYLRMQYEPADTPTFEHAALIFTTACEVAVEKLSTDILL